MTTEIMAGLNTETASYVVGTLATLSKQELSATEYLVRKIERNTGVESKGVVIPAVTGEGFIVALENDSVLAAAVAWYQEQIAEVVKARMTAGRAVIHDVDFELAEVAKYLSEQEVKQGRISKGKIEAWFDSALVSGINAAFVEKLGTQYTDTMRSAVNVEYKKWFGKLTTTDLTMEADTKGSLLKACSFAPADSAIRQYCETKIKEAKLPTAMLKLL